MEAATALTIDMPAMVATSGGERAATTGRDARIMIVDDEPVNIKLVAKHLRDAGYHEFITTSDPREALELITRERPDVVVLDIMMPHVNGLDVLRAVRNNPRTGHLPVLMVTASSDEDTKTRALELGATDFLHKPVRPAELIPRVRNSLLLKAHHDNLRSYSARLELDVRQRTAELEESRHEVLRVLATAAEYRDNETGNHVVRVGKYAGIVAAELGLAPAHVEMLERASVLHDVGKIGIPDAILLKPGKLTEEEMDVMRRHCEYGRNILVGAATSGGASGSRRTRSPLLKMAAVIALTHHEKWDGSGYPLGLRGEEIPIEGRITAIADVFDALGSARPYKKAFPLEKCFAIIIEGRGQHFDPAVVDAFLRAQEAIVKVATELADR